MADIFNLDGYEPSRQEAETLAATVEDLPLDVRSTKLFLLLAYLKSTVQAIGDQLPPGPERDGATKALRTVVAYSEAHFRASTERGAD
ncbi:hypothetical protein SEA_DATBOI_80 [Gordonia phage DatBoi]|nr:hypothetical protein SEA_DATBOI_80 [Gordonia phage DatBoi]